MLHPRHIYALALGSNQPLSARLGPREILGEAVLRIGAEAGDVLAVSPIIVTPPLGPSRRRYVNAALLLESIYAPDILLACLQQIESALGRRRHRRWGARSLDIDILLWSGGIWADATLAIPHAAFPIRDFVLSPLLSIAPDWRDPLSGLTVRQLRARLRHARPRTVDRSPRPY